MIDMIDLPLLSCLLKVFFSLKLIFKFSVNFSVYQPIFNISYKK